MSKPFRFVWYYLRAIGVFFGEAVAGIIVIAYDFIIHPIYRAWRDFK
jgi:hypothetical protein